MKKSSLLLTLFCGLLYVTLTSKVNGPGATVGADYIATGCGGAGCHTSGVAFFFNGITLLDASGTTTLYSYTPGGSYRILIAAGPAPATLPKFGFQLKATTASGATAGTMTPVAGTHTVTVGGVLLAEHSLALNTTGTTDSISIPWTAPPAGTGNVTLAGALNAVDGSGTPSGDMYTTVASTIAEDLPIAGTFSVCVGGTTSLTHPTAGGSWSSSTATIGTVGALTGVVTGLAAGTTTISYNVTIFGIGWITATQVVTVVPVPATSVTGASSVCVGKITSLTGSPASGTWTSLDPAKAIVSSAGVVSGVAAGTATIKYKVTNVCGTPDSASKVLTITAFSPSCILAVNPASVNTEGFHIYPNPNRGLFTLDLASPLNGEAYVVVTNATGAKVKDFTVMANNKVDVVLNQPPGVYFIAATTLTQRYFVKVVVE